MINTAACGGIVNIHGIDNTIFINGKSHDGSAHNGFAPPGFSSINCEIYNFPLLNAPSVDVYAQTVLQLDKPGAAGLNL